MVQCFNSNPSHVQDWLDDNACFGFFCEDACNSPFKPPPDCQACLQGPCSKEYLDCESNRDCLLLKVCISECQEDAACRVKCVDTASAQATSLFEIFRLCTRHRCEDAC